MSNASTTITVLNRLIETLKDGQEGFRAAAEDVRSGDVRALFNSYSLQRAKFAGELQTLVQSLGDSDPETTGSVAGAIHRGWIDLKSAIMSKDDHAILAECERGEDSAVAEYSSALENTDLPTNVRDVISRQAAEIKEAHDRVRDLRDGLAPA